MIREEGEEGMIECRSCVTKSDLLGASSAEINEHLSLFQ